MNDAPVGLAQLGFWPAAALVVVAIVWAGVKKQQMKHELTLKLLEEGQAMDPELLAKLLGKPVQPESAAERRREQSGGFIALSLIGGVLLAFVGIVMPGHTMQPVAGHEPLMMWVDKGPAWPIIGLGAFSFAFGCLRWVRANREYKREKAEEMRSRD